MPCKPAIASGKFHLPLLLALVAFILAWPQAAHAESGEKLLKVVALSRHGVRAPTQTDRLLEMWSRKTWPAWPVSKGDLTPRGAALISAMWKEMRGLYEANGLLPEAACPPAGAIHVRADTDERTRATAAALLAGLAPDCHLSYSVAEKIPDPLFHPVKAGLYKFEPVPTVANILNMAPGGLGQLQEDFSSAFNLLNRIAGPPASALCARFAEGPDCNISDLPNAISVSADGRDVNLIGSLHVASSMAEIFLLEYAEWPGALPGWGQVNSAALKQLLPVHSKIFDVVNRAPLVARARGGALLREMEQALQGRHTDKRLNEAKLLVFVGHDTNIANLGGLLGANWKARDFPANGIPPGSLLAMELWDNSGKREIRLRFYAQTLEAFHSDLSANGGEAHNGEVFAPSRNPVNVPPVLGEARFSQEEFARLVSGATQGAPLAPHEKTRQEEGMPAASR